MFSLFPQLPPQLAPLLGSIWAVWVQVWWLVTPIILGIIFWDAWKLYLHVRFARGIDWQLLEIKIPKNVLKTPKAMEQIFAAAHAPYSYGFKWYQKYVQGMEEYYMSFELVGRAGESHFYLRLPSQFRNMMESAIYGQYPDAEIFEADDYLEEMPHVLPNEDYDLSGFEEVLRHDSYLPIRTYISFEDPVEERRIDTIAGLMEVMSKLKEQEQLWFQVIVRPTGENFMEEGQERINKILNIKDEEEHKTSIFPDFDLGFSLNDAIRAPFEHPGLEPAESSHKEEKRQNGPRIVISPTEEDVIKNINLKIGKLAHEATLRFMLIYKKDQAHDPNHLMSVHGFVRQFNTQHLNSLKPDNATTTAGYAVKGLFKKTRLRFRKRLLYEHYLHTAPAHHESILNIEELATVFHFPLGTTSTTELEKVESRKGSPPASLPIIEE